MSSRTLKEHFRKEIEAVRLAVHDLQSGWPSGLKLSTNPRPSIFDCYPYFFLDAFPGIRAADVASLNVALHLLANSIFLYDKLMDPTRVGVEQADAAFGVQFMQLECYDRLFALFPPRSPFWSRFRQQMARYAQACLLEAQFARGERPWAEFTRPVAFEIATGKSAMTAVVIAGLAELAGDDRCYERLVAALDRFDIAVQLWDDLQDWQDDLDSGMPSLLLVRMLGERPQPQRGADRDQLRRRIAAALYRGEHGTWLLTTIRETVGESLALLDPLPLPRWREVVAEFLEQCEALARHLGLGERCWRDGLENRGAAAAAPETLACA
ncbi:MAG: hypothetical protein HYV63_12775 [Candidatus Schekmanbacteria bacterium]|nr:hypothetical protein [Candidatus Schekmanbacteria bacterium]